MQAVTSEEMWSSTATTTTSSSSSSSESDLEKSIRSSEQQPETFIVPTGTADYLRDYAGATDRRPGGVDDLGIKEGAWSAGLCGCCDHCVPNCFMVTCCPCVSAAQISTRLGMAAYKPTLATAALVISAQVVSLLLSTYVIVVRMTQYLDGASVWSNAEEGEQADADSFLNAALLMLVPGAYMAVVLYVFQLHIQTRMRFQIGGSCCGDFCAASCCTHCAVAQIATHVGSYTPRSCDFDPPDALPPYEYAH